MLIKKVTREDMPATCTRCMSEPLPDGIKFNGRYPDVNNRISWFEGDQGWSVQFIVESNYSVNLKLPIKHKMIVGTLHCFSCNEEYSQLLKEEYSALFG